MTKLTKKRFVISKSLIGKNVTITFTNKKDETYTYDHDEVFSNNQEKLLSMTCFNEYGNYTNSNKIPKWAI
jgi:hypothetical protein|tara:strand:+ start:218 stop:430 length:213 start_codon:yes stop_codon:yes gene_type:complete